MVKFLEVSVVEVIEGVAEYLTVITEPIGDKTKDEIDALPIKAVDAIYDAGLLDIETRITPQLFSAP